MKTQILFFIIMNYGLLHNAWAQTYSMADSIALEAIDMACDTSDNLNWNTESDPGMWEGVIWNSENPKRVATLNIWDKLLTGEMDLTALTGLTALSCYNNQLASLNVSNLGNLVNLSCFNNQLNTLDISAVNNLSYFTCSMNQLTELPLSGLTNLTYLSCGINQLSSLDVSDLVNLNYLSCNVNNIELLDVSNLPDLTELYCQANQLKELHVSPLANFSYLFCYENRLPFSSLVTCRNTANLTYSPQYNIFEPENLSKDTLIDYSSEALIDTSATKFVFYKNGVEVETNTTGLLLYHRIWGIFLLND